MFQPQKELSKMIFDSKIYRTSWIRITTQLFLILSCLSLVLSSHSSTRYSAPLNTESEDDFRPMISPQYHHSEHLERDLFTKSGQYRIFAPAESDLRVDHQLKVRDEKEKRKNISTTTSSPEGRNDDIIRPESSNDEQDSISTDLMKIADLLSDYFKELLSDQKDNITNISDTNVDLKQLETTNLEKVIKRLVRSTEVSVALPKVAETGRFFITGISKILWPIFLGIQVIKSILFAMFLPSLIGSFTKVAGQGSSPFASFSRPSEAVNDLNFKDNFENDSKFMLMNGDYAYNKPAASTTHYSTQMFDATAINNNALSRFGVSDPKDGYMNALSYNEEKKTNNKEPSSLTQVYESFKNVPASSLLLSNYDPFYSPLLSRLDSVFQQLGLKTNDENCREKAICFMYSSPEKYTPYSNLVSAQLSREIEELRKPTSDSQEILRFFKYMKAAKDGQDGVKCEEQYSMCPEFKDFEDLAMIHTYNDINKLVEARKIQ